MKPQIRRLLIVAAAAVAGALAWFAPEPDPTAGPQPSPSPAHKGPPAAAVADTRPAAPRNQAGSQAAADGGLPARGALAQTSQDLFATRSWVPPPPPPAPLPPPVPPPNPYRFAGRVVQDGQTQVFLAKGGTTVPAKVGAVLDGVYRIDDISPSRVLMTYLPLTYREVIPVESPADSALRPTALPPPVAGLSPAVPGVPISPAMPGPAATPLPPPGPPANAHARVQWAGPLQVKAGMPFSLTLRVNTEQPISGAPMQLRFDPKLLEWVAAQPGRVFSPAGGGNFNVRANSDGTVGISASTAAAPASGQVDLVVVSFKPLRAGQTAEIALSSLNLQAPGGKPVALDAPPPFKVVVAP